MIKISVLITTYNLEKYIAGALESVLCQKGNFEMEILVGDDGSRDNTINVIANYIMKYPEKIRLFIMHREEGINYNRVERSSANRINLLEHATGDYICFLDGDDFYTDDRKFEKQLAYLEKDKSLSACTHNVVLYSADDSPMKAIEGQTLSRAKKEHIWTFDKYWSLEFIQANAMLFRNYYRNGNELFSKSLKEELDNNLALKNNFDDNNITFAFSLYGDICYLPEIMGAYRQLEGSSWNGIDELKKNCSNMIGYSLEQMLIELLSREGKRDKKYISLIKEASLSRHYKDFAYLSEHKELLIKDNCQPFYDTAKKYNIEFAFMVYELSDNKNREFDKVFSRSVYANKKATNRTK